MIRILKALGAAIALLLLTVAPPAFLILAIGNPWPAEGVSLTAPLTDNAIMSVIAVALWIVWAQMVVSFIVEAYAAISDRAVDIRLPVLGFQQDLARALIGAILTSIVAAAPIGAGLATHDAAAHAPPPRAPTSQIDQRHDSDRHTPTAPDRGSAVRGSAVRGSGAALATDSDQASAKPPDSGITVTVQRGDTLWSLAEQYLGDGDRWAEIASANRDQTMVDGAQFTSAHSIRPGWHLTIPGAQPEADAQANAESAAGSAAGSDAGSDAGPRDGTYQVEADDTLWGISEEQLGDGASFPEIFEASQDIVQPGGDRLADPDHVEPGWTLAVPGTGSSPTAASGSAVDEVEDREGKGNGAGDEHQPPAMSWRAPQSAPDLPERYAVTPRSDSSAPSSGAPDSSDGVDGAADLNADERSVLDAGWVLTGLTGGGVLLAGALYLGLQRRRRAQFRGRRPGRAIAAPPAESVPAERTINAVGGTAAATVAFMDEALRRLAERSRTGEVKMPRLAAVQLHGELVTLHLSGPADLPAPWQASSDQLRWSCSTTASAQDLGPDHGWAEAPYPMLVTIGRDGAEGRENVDDLWLLNCEELGTIEIVGDATLVEDFARHVAAQLAVNPWSQHVSVGCVGIAEETETLGERTRYYRSGREGDHAICKVLADAVSMVDRTDTFDTDVSTGRAGAPDDEVWPANMLLVTRGDDAGATGDVAVHEEPQAVTGQPLLELSKLVSTHVGCTGTAILLVGTPAGEPTEELSTAVIRLTSDGRVLLEQQGLDLAAVGLTSEETRGCALLYAHSEIPDDVEVPVDEDAREGWEALVDQTGAPRRTLTLPRCTSERDLEEPVTTLLNGADEGYVAAAPAVTKDLEALAPKVPETVRARVRAEDPTLDADLAAWFDPQCPRPKLTLLGPVSVRTYGRPLAKYKALCTEIVAYLALRPRIGATRDELAEAVGWDDPSRVRKYVDLVRHWLGEDPETSEHYLPHANKSPAARSRGVNVYQVTAGLLSDWDLFRRLRARGTHRDLSRALQLVTGRPFDQLRPGGWSWLYQGNPHDQYAAHAIADVAFTVVTHCLHEGDLGRARTATEVAIMAVPDEQVVQLCRVAMTEAEGNNAEAMRILLEDVCNRAEDGEGPLDLPARTQEIIRNHRWMAS